jgi:hypothetical protein
MPALIAGAALSIFLFSNLIVWFVEFAALVGVTVAASAAAVFFSD